MSQRARARLGALLGQTSVADFAAEVWSRAFLIRRAGEGPDLTTIFTLADADELLGSHALRTPFLRVAKDGVVAPASSFTRSGGVGATIADQVDTDRVLRLLVDGSTVVFQGLHRAWPSVQEFSTDLALDLGHPVQANAYLTPSSARGFAAHYDTHDVFVIQLAGSKHWTIHPPAVDIASGLSEWTAHRAEVEAAATAEPAFDGMVEPGDVLYLPQGWIHSAQAGDATSLHLTLGVHPYSERDVLDIVVADAVAQLRSHRSLPVGVDIADPGEITAVVDALVGELVGALSGVKADEVARRLAMRRSRDVRSEPVRPIMQADAADSQSTDSPAPVILRKGFPPRIHENSDGLTLDVDGAEFTFPSGSLDALRRIVAGEVCVATSLPGLDDTSGRELIRGLLLAGVVVPAGQ